MYQLILASWLFPDGTGEGCIFGCNFSVASMLLAGVRWKPQRQFLVHEEDRRYSTCRACS